MRYFRDNTNPHAYLILFEKRIEECRLAGISIDDSYISQRFYESVINSFPDMHQFAYMYKLLRRVTVIPYHELKNCFLGIALRKTEATFKSKTLKTSVKTTVSKNEQKNKRNISDVSDPCKRCKNASHSNKECENKTCPHCRATLVNSQHIEKCSKKGKSSSSSQNRKQTSNRNSDQNRDQRRYRPYNNNTRTLERNTRRGSFDARSSNRPQNQRTNRQYHQDNDNSRDHQRRDYNPQRTNGQQIAEQQRAQYARLENGVLVVCHRDDENALLIPNSAHFARPRDTGKNNNVSYLTNPTPPSVTVCADSGSTIHLFNSTISLSNLRSLNTPKIIQVANASNSADLIIDKIGELDIQLGANLFKLSPIHYNSSVCENLLSIRPFANAGYQTLFLKDTVHILAPNSINLNELQPLLKGFSKGQLWYFNLPIASVDSFSDTQ